MSVAAALRKLGLTLHVSTSVGWFGAVLVFLIVAIVGLRGRDTATVSAAYLSLEWMMWLAIVPLCFASLITGVLQSLITPWGLVRHYWVALKLLLTCGSTSLLLVHTRVADLAARMAVNPAHLEHMQPLRTQLVTDAALALAVLVINTVLAVYKPRGVINYRWGRA